MPTFFAADSDNPVGRTIALADSHTQGTMGLVGFDADTQPIAWDTERSIITRITLSQQGNFQFLHTIGNDVYIYVFGDRVGQVTLSGLSMARACNCPGVDEDKEHGFEKIMKWYNKNRVAVNPNPVTVNIGKTPIQGFVIGLNGDVVDPSTQLVQYSLQIATIPTKR